jgi:hypothetical protein
MDKEAKVRDCKAVRIDSCTLHPYDFSGFKFRNDRLDSNTPRPERDFPPVQGTGEASTVAGRGPAVKKKKDLGVYVDDLARESWMRTRQNIIFTLGAPYQFNRFRHVVSSSY